MSSRETSNLEVREALLQRFLNQKERRYDEITSNDNLIKKRKKYDMKYLRELINPENNQALKSQLLLKLTRRITDQSSILFTLNDLDMLGKIIVHNFSTRPRLLDDPRFLPSQRITESFSRPASSFLNQVSPQISETPVTTYIPETPTRQTRTRPRSPSIRGPRRQDEITPGVWIRGTPLPIYTTGPRAISQTQSLEPERIPWGYEPWGSEDTTTNPISSVPQTQSQEPERIPQGYEDTTTDPMSSVPPTPLTPEPIFEEDRLPNTKTRSNKNSLIFNEDQSNLSTCDDKDNDPDEKTLSKDNKKWVEANCLSCQDIATQYNYTPEQWSDLVSIKQLDSKGKFKLSQCISIKYFKESLKRDLSSFEQFNRKNFQTIFSIYKLKNENLQESDLRRGLGTRPTNILLFKLDLPSGKLFIDLESAYKLIHNKTKELYALPLYGGLRRRVGNLKGSLMEISTDHGQIDGYKIYRLLTRSEIENEMEIDFELQLLIESQKLLQLAYKDNETNTLMISNVVNYIIDILTGKKSAY